ncbi:protein-export translocase membrane protein SecDF [Psychroflexus torquis ATCC 700755]|uniref:Multifunctional fusion protein n=1 Tax=Psychroflexus torquis (strain ATCC 700755 / CIP 106069 / ACAM 623) TaxID=313595 RepID=K4IHT8_PSYTT|nr:protein translocase subunit SecDF [Psychroflexus torquis]AFU69378.1 protein-export translocase membrane protein SecDF [Psychroflexus torquis ATCC 700755]
MQNKGLIKLFAVLFALVSIYQLSFTFIASNVETEAEIFAESEIPESVENFTQERNNAAEQYLDSIGNESIFAGISYNTAKGKELNKGLDLKGGINVILQISVGDLLKGLANNSKDPAFNQAIADAGEARKNSQDSFLELFYQAFESKEGASLASPDIFGTKALSDEVSFDMENSSVKPIINRKIDESVTSAFEVLRERIDKFGVTQPNIQRLGDSGRILIELPGAKDISRIQNLLQSTAQLEFWDVYRANEFSDYLVTADAIVSENIKSETEKSEETQVEADEQEETETDDLESLLSSEDEEIEDFSKSNPLLSLVQTVGQPQGPIIAYFAIKDTAKVNSYLSMPQVKSQLPAGKKFAKFVWGKPAKDSEIIELYALKGNRNNEPQLSGAVVTDAQQTYDQVGRLAVSMQMDGRGSKIWEDMTGKASSQGSQIAIVLDNIVYSAPGVSSGPITGGRSEISGEFSIEEAQDLANVLRAGKLPASANIVQSEIVGPSLGQEAIDSGVLSFGIALIFVLLYMIFYYGKAGIYADIALVVNILFIFGVLSGLGAVLTLPGIAGIVLTIGMSVDANVLIFERIREELAKGKTQAEAISDGFKNALSSILDANITTGLTGLILLTFGTGPIKGFATTLLIGIVTSLFCAIFLTRLFIAGGGKKGKSLPFSTGITKNWFLNIDIDFLKKRKVAYIISALAILISIGSLATKGLNQGVDFVGGRSYTVRFEQPVNPTEIQTKLVQDLLSVEAKTYGSSSQLKITTNYKIEEEGTVIDDEIQAILFNNLKEYLPGGMILKSFKVGESGNDEKEFGIMSSIKVGPTIADDIKTASYYAIIGSLIVVFLYILLRFRRWQFSLGAVAAVIHDVIIVLGLFSLLSNVLPFSLEIDQAFIAAILTVIGYSLNDTVVVFDRIREYFNEHPTWKMHKLINLAVSSTISRTINTSLTTLVVLTAIFIFGGDSIRGFMFALIIGVVVGTYSSVFIATPVMFDSVNKKGIDLSTTVAEEKGQVNA